MSGSTGRGAACTGQLKWTLTGLFSTIVLALSFTPASYGALRGSIGPDYESPIIVGETNKGASLTLTNSPTGDDMDRRIRVLDVRHAPACGVSGVEPMFVCPEGQREDTEPRVFTVVGTTGQGSGGFSGCEGTWTISAPDPARGGELIFTPPGGAGTLILGAPSVDPANTVDCIVSFQVDVNRLPEIDADAGLEGKQTRQLAYMNIEFIDQPGVSAPQTGLNVVTVQEPPPTPTVTPTNTPTPTNTISPTPSETPVPVPVMESPTSPFGLVLVLGLGAVMVAFMLRRRAVATGD